MCMMVMDTIIGFEWDDGNIGKVEARGFTVSDVERAFLNGRGTYFPDLSHSEAEERYWLIGITDDGRHITVPFTVRTERVRPITAWTTARKYRKWVR
ncbi:MAG: BrnT family toxin [Acidobacteria bacterium]|nr:BrnT family toxin [Acidobacteriota bacterium]